MKIQTSELTGAALDWAVAKCEGLCEGDFAWYYDRRDTFKYSTNWAQGGPIIERERLEIIPKCDRWDALTSWDAMMNNQHIPNEGPTPLIAAMRCYVASKLGDEIDVLDELI